MKTYKVIQTVKATPMTLGEFIDKTGADPFRRVSVDTDSKPSLETSGYLLEYECGYQSWCAEKVFEKVSTEVSETKSNMVTHAEYEMQLAWGTFSEMDELQRLMCDQVLEVLSLLSTHGDSGSSMPYKMNLLQRLVELKTISPLKLDEAEFGEPFDTEMGTRQNRRLSSLFLNNSGKIYTIDGLRFEQTFTCYTYDDPEKKPFFEENECKNCWSGGTFVFKNDGTIGFVRTCYLKDKEHYSKTFTVKCYDIEYPKDWWIRFTTEENLKEAREYYDIPYADDSEEILKKEVSHEDGRFTENILRRIELLKEFIKSQKVKMNFGEVITALKAGKCAARSGWNGKNMFICKQVPSTISAEIVPKMQSLPQSAKEMIAFSLNPSISYQNQMIIIHPDGRIDSWVPSVSDIFAEDWVIV